LKRFDHFAVLRKKSGGLAYMSDPVLGQVTLDEASSEGIQRRGAGDLAVIYYRRLFFGLSVIRDPIAVNRMLGSLGGLGFSRRFRRSTSTSRRSRIRSRS